jgi:iron complex transport system permease protein
MTAPPRAPERGQTPTESGGLGSRDAGPRGAGPRGAGPRGAGPRGAGPWGRTRGRARGRAGAPLLLATALLVAAVAVGTGVGAVALSPTAVAGTLLDALPGVTTGWGLDGVEQRVLLELRLPRVALAALVGALLACAGAGYQGVFRNPLADPYLLGAAAGAGLGATLVLVTAGPAGPVAPAAFAGALAGVSSAYALGRVAARSGGGGAGLVLAGVAVASFLTAAQTFVLQAHSDSLQQVYAFVLGRLGGADWPTVVGALPYAALSLAALCLAARRLDVLAVGDDEAASLGVRPERVRLLVLAAASLATATAVAAAGLIGFVGLVVPHVVRRLAGPGHAVLLPVCALGGAGFVVLADVVARTVVAPAELPLGVVTAFVGAPFFALLLARGSRL